MNIKRLSGLLVLAILAVPSLGHAQNWADAYGRALGAFGQQDYAGAKAAMAEAIALRPEDQSQPTTLPGSLTEPIKWRSGSPYSPNFATAYATYKMAQAAAEPDKAALFTEAVTAFETLLAKNQASDAVYYFLYQAYGEQRRIDKQREIEATMKQSGQLPWKVDTSFVTPEEASGILLATGAKGNKPNVVVAGADTTPGGRVATTPPDVATTTSRVPIVPTKYAFLIGNSESADANNKVGFATANAQMLREALIQSAGYDEANVDMVLNGTAEGILAAAKALVERMSDDATVFLYFSGTGVNVGGKDYYAGIDVAGASDTSKMVAKSALYQIFLNKGAKIFVFNECHRPIKDGRYFGQEDPLVGRIAQSHATVPGGMVYGMVTTGREVGSFAKAMYDVLTEFRSNSVPIMEFGWQVFNSLRGASPGGVGGQSRQTPTLPGVFNMATDAKF
ncbi:MAG: caspase family protein [Fimbriimonadaceae bacterium]